jgi:1,4-dihydroxy-2-naphthoate octaprenyltransferase
VTSQVSQTVPGAALPASRPSRSRIWLQAVRVRSFTASAIPILIASALAAVDKAFEPHLFVLMLVAAVSCHAGANLANDYFDHQKGVDTSESLGPSKVIQQGLLAPAEVKRGMVAAFAVATLLGLLIVASAGWPIFILALASIAAAYFYTGGPKPLGYVALGELTVFVFMGPVMICGAYYVHAREVSWEAAVVSAGVGALVANHLHANNMRDIALDRRAGKVTMATLLGRRKANHEYLTLLVATYVPTGVLIALEPRFWPALAVVVTVPTAAALARLAYSAAEPEELNRLLRRTAGLHLRFGSTLTAGILLRALLDRL